MNSQKKLNQVRLDWFLSNFANLSRQQAKRAIKLGEVKVSSLDMLSSSTKFNANNHHVFLKGQQISVREPTYIALYKPKNYICSHEESHYPSAFQLLTEENQHASQAEKRTSTRYLDTKKLQIAGRLDADTTGLILITDDGEWNHKITTPKHQCYKTYEAQLTRPLTTLMKKKLEQGVQLNGEKLPTLPAKLTVNSDTPNIVQISICEGKYHQIKRMFSAVENTVNTLHRQSIGNLSLDLLKPNQWRYLTQQEINNLTQ